MEESDMNEKERILDLVKKGVISSQEAISLLEELGKNQGEASKVSEQEKKDASTYQKEDEKRFDTVLDSLASVVTNFSSEWDEEFETLNQVTQQVKQKEERIEELHSAKVLDKLTVEQEMELQRLTEELEVLRSQQRSLEEEKKAAQDEMKRLKKEEFDEKLKKAKQKIEETDWQQTTSDSLSQLGGIIGRFAGQFAKAAAETARNVSATIKDHPSFSTMSPFFYQTSHSYAFEEEFGEIGIIEIKVANGDIKMKTAPQSTVTIEGEFRLNEEFETQEEIEQYINERLNVSLENDTFKFFIPSKKVYADVTFVFPEKEYDYVSVKGLNSGIRMKDFTGKDFYAESQNGEISVKNVSGTMLELTSKNGTIKQLDGQFKDTILDGTNGNIIFDAEAESATLKTVNGSIKVKKVVPNAKQVMAKTVNGSVQLDVPESLELEATLSTSLGKLHYDDAQYEVIKHEKTVTSHSVVLRRQKETVPVRITGKTTTGSVTLNPVQ